MPAEQLFVEEVRQGGGFLAIVLPRSIANNPGLKFRRWLIGSTRIVVPLTCPKRRSRKVAAYPTLAF